MTGGTAPTEGHSVSVVVPVYRGESTLPGLLDELTSFFEPHTSADGHVFQVTEVLLSYDNGPGPSDEVIRKLSEQLPQVRPIWLTRNFGQHAATLAGMASSGGDWIVTMDEDGQHDPAYLPQLLDTAMRDRAGVVYALPTNEPPHGLLRNLASKGSKWLVERWVRDIDVSSFQSYRLILGEVGRSVAAYAGAGVYLDVALSWVNGRVSQQPVVLRARGRAVRGAHPACAVVGTHERHRRVQRPARKPGQALCQQCCAVQWRGHTSSHSRGTRAASPYLMLSRITPVPGFSTLLVHTSCRLRKRDLWTPYRSMCSWWRTTWPTSR